MSQSQFETAKVSVDFSKWCQYQRQGLIGPIANGIDRIYDCAPLYQQIHVIPMKMWWFFQDSARIPEQGPIAGPRAVPGLHRLGEGMHQKLWALVTGCGIVAQMYRRGLDCDIMGSGDNQFLSCKVWEVLDPRETQRLILEGLRTFSELSYLPIKMEETFVSGHYINTAKSATSKGRGLVKLSSDRQE